MRSFAEERFDLPEGAFPFDSHFMDIGQARLHYIREGEGPILFFLHGNPTWSFSGPQNIIIQPGKQGAGQLFRLSSICSIDNRMSSNSGGCPKIIARVLS